MEREGASDALELEKRGQGRARAFATAAAWWHARERAREEELGRWLASK
jgi:hypothetical protein